MKLLRYVIPLLFCSANARALSIYQTGYGQAPISNALIGSTLTPSNLYVQNNGVVGTTLTVTGNAFSVGATTLTVNGGITNIAGSTLAVTASTVTFANQYIYIPGRIDGSISSPGYIGQISSAPIVNNPNVAASTVWNSLSTMTLTAGVWFVWATGQLDTGNASATDLQFCISNTANNCDVASSGNITRTPMTLTANTANLPVGPRVYNITSSQAVFLTGNLTYSALGTATYDQNSFMQAIRIR